MATQKLFFSYSRADGSAFAARLAADLKEKGFDVWIDQKDIKAGSSWDTEIEKALETCDCLLFIETEKSVTSKHVLDEVYYAMEQNKKVIPLIYVDSKTPFRLNRLQHIDFTQNYHSGLDLLVNELNHHPTDLSYAPDGGETVGVKTKPFRNHTRTWVLAACCFAVLAAVLVLTLAGKSDAVADTKETATVADTAASKVAATSDSLSPSPVENSQPYVQQPTETAARTKTSVKTRPALAPAGVGKKSGAESQPAVTEEKKPSLPFGEAIAGNWQLAGMEPQSKEHRGYLKIEALDENKMTIKSYMQFYYPDRDAAAYLTVFNAFAGCASCPVANEIKLMVEDIAVGSRTIKKLDEDGPDGQKAGDIILDASSNKSMRGTATLQFLDEKTAVITIKQPKTVTLSNALVLDPFVYTFRFIKDD